MSRSDPDGPKAGFTLLETLVVLAILAGITALVASNTRGPSPQLALQQRSQEVRTQIVDARAKAIATQVAQTLDADLQSCDGTAAKLVAFPDGSLFGPDICISVDDLQMRLIVDGVTGRVFLADLE